MKLSTKISSSMGTLTALIAILAAYLLVQMGNVNDTVTALAERNIPVIELAGKLNNDMSEYRMSQVLHIYASEPEQMRINEEHLADWKKNLNNYLADLDGHIKKTGNVRGALEKVRTGMDGYFAMSVKRRNLCREMKTEEAVKELLGNSHKAYLNLSGDINALVAAAKQNADEQNALGDEMYERSNMIGTALTCLLYTSPSPRDRG